MGEKYPQGLPLKFYGESFGAIKIFGNGIFTADKTGSRPEVTSYMAHQSSNVIIKNRYMLRFEFLYFIMIKCRNLNQQGTELDSNIRDI